MERKKSNRYLSECTDYEMVDLISSEVMSGPTNVTDIVSNAIQSVASISKDDAFLKTRLSQYIGMLRGMQLWYHAAHHVTRGASFFGDHADLYGTLYEEVGGDVDSAVEKAIGLTNDENMANPCNITDLALKVLKKYPCPPTLTALALSSTALQIENDFLTLLEAIFIDCENKGCLSVGLNDLLAATANKHEGYVYKLQQRVKTELEN